MKHINPDVVKAQIANLLTQHPDLQEDMDALAMSLESETDAVSLLNQLLARLQQTKATAAGLANWLSDLRSRLDMLERREEGLRRIMFKLMEASGLPRQELVLGTISMAMGPRKVIVADETVLPKECLRYPPPEPDKIKIMEWLKQGFTVNGAFLSNGEQVLRISVT